MRKTAALVLALGPLLAAGVAGCGGGAPAPGSLTANAQVQCRQEIRHRVAGAKFTDELVVYQDGRYVVKGHVTADAVGGGRTGADYRCVVATRDGGDSWKLLDLKGLR